MEHIPIFIITTIIIILISDSRGSCQDGEYSYKEYCYTCPEEFSYYQGHCYKYVQWSRRHYEPEAFKFQETWKQSLDYCIDLNATLLSILDEDEAYFVKVSRELVQLLLY